MSRLPLPVFTWLLFATALPHFAAHTQQVPEIPAPSDTVYEIRLGDGTLIFARIAAVDGERVEFATVDGGRIEVDRDQVHELRPARGRVVGSGFWHEDPVGNRLIVTPTGRALRRGEWHLGTYAIVLPFVALGVTNRISISAGAPVIFGQVRPLFVGPKVQVVRRPTVQMALGTIALLDGDDSAGVAYGAATFGDADTAFTTGVGYYYTGERVSSRPAFLLGAELRVSRRIKLITENYILADAPDVLYSAGIRVIGDRFTIEIAMFGATMDGRRDCCGPILSFARPFGG